MGGPITVSSTASDKVMMAALAHDKQVIGDPLKDSGAPQGQYFARAHAVSIYSARQAPRPTNTPNSTWGRSLHDAIHSSNKN